MEYWEFLLQKEGDQSWLPLDTSQVEILEGRYRVMAHTSHANTPVHIQIDQVLTDSRSDPSRNRQGAGGEPEPPARRSLRRQGQINENGLMVVMPFTRLGEGAWDIQCASAIAANPENASAAAPSSWCYAVQLRVVAQDSADDGDWFADDGSAGLGAIAAPPSPLAAGTPAAAPVPVIDLQTAAAAMDALQTQLANGLAEDTLPYGLTLPHTALLGSAGESLGLVATVTGRADGEPCPPLTLVVRLSDPQTSATVAMAPVPLAVATLPSTMALTVSVPTQLSTRLLLGDVGLFVGAEAMTLQQFTVTVDVASLFDAIANQAETDTDLDVVFPADDPEAGADSPPPPAPDIKAWDLVGRAAPPREMPILTLPRNSPELPPKIYYPSPHEAAAHQPSLPLVGRPRPATPTPGDRSSTTPADPSPEPARGLSLPPIAPPPKADDPIAVLTGQTPSSSSGQPRGAAPQLISHEAMGFKDLKLQDRFWSRLNELAVNLQQEAIDQRSEIAVPPASVEAEDPIAVPPPFVPFAGEVVIYEDEDPTLQDLQTAATVPAPESEEPSEVVTPPMPSLELPEGDLTAGEPVVVTLRVPFHPNRLYLKVWITDPQTRTLADEPRQVLNLLPNGQGQLEGSLQLTAPFGCLEAWFEAISVDMVTQQESYKASVSRAIAPAGLPSTSLDEFQL
ncbi:hypothetical protein VB780_04035 [Leptolyngbya sp. CCNP1308]|uniref:hypothetical protein n=1 Tax=Leptolyngbya sp. CCNP1308 TaxID=3110255 RepID=UPI002B203DD0|nr:hypothetical protein [Leptolyngbya sp. CCNP1308]MEA5447725.1 hypothetical protein [Leptolyngbya sp. CCNP1308]